MSPGYTIPKYGESPREERVGGITACVGLYENDKKDEMAYNL